jgi:nicotinate-nucleotide--dimethylbenzimidazole phosphoribosyltransferase
MPLSFKSLCDFTNIAAKLPNADEGARAQALARQGNLTKPQGSLGRLEDLAVFMAGWRGTPRPKIARAQALIFAGNHGICAQGVNPFPQEVTAQMVANFKAGGAAINQLCRVNGADLHVVPLELDRPTADFTAHAAMTETEVLAALRAGVDAVDIAADVLILGEMGIGNSTVAAALCASIFGGEAGAWVGAGTGADAAGQARKVAAIEAGLSRHNAPKGMDALVAFGGREQAALCGAVLAARAKSIPVVLDGFICTAAVAPLFSVSPTFLDHCLIGHRSAEKGHRKLLAQLNKTAILEMDMRLGEGSGAALALGVLRSALACHNGMATFGEAGVSDG